MSNFCNLLFKVLSSFSIVSSILSMQFFLLQCNPVSFHYGPEFLYCICTTSIEFFFLNNTSLSLVILFTFLPFQVQIPYAHTFNSFNTVSFRLKFNSFTISQCSYSFHQLVIPIIFFITKKEKRNNIFTLLKQSHKGTRLITGFS